jgi:hypothetical protein
LEQELSELTDAEEAEDCDAEGSDSGMAQPVDAEEYDSEEEALPVGDDARDKVAEGDPHVGTDEASDAAAMTAVKEEEDDAAMEAAKTYSRTKFGLRQEWKALQARLIEVGGRPQTKPWCEREADDIVVVEDGEDKKDEDDEDNKFVVKDDEVKQDVDKLERRKFRSVPLEPELPVGARPQAKWMARRPPVGYSRS